MKQKLFTLFAAVLCVASIMASDTKVDGIWYDFNESTLTASVTFRGSTYTSYANEYTGNVVIPDTVTYSDKDYAVTSIGNNAFRGCSGLTSIEIPNSVTSIGWSAFYDCTGLTSITIPNSVTVIGDWAFFGSSGLTAFNVADDNPNYCSVDGVLFNKDTTTLIQYPRKSTMSSYMMPESVTLINRSAFSSCKVLTSVTISNSVTSIGIEAFRDCSNLTSVTIGNSVTSIGSSAFYMCTGLKSVTIPNSVIEIGSGAFEDCKGLTSITIPESVTSIGNNAFSDCTGLTEITIPNSVTSIGIGPFRGCTKITSINVADDNPNYCSADGVLFNKDKTTLIQYPAKSSASSYTIPNSVTTIESYSFYQSSGLTSVTIPESVTSIGNSAFLYCTGLTSITIPNLVTSIGSQAFYSCKGLTSINIPESVTLIDKDAFIYCSGLKEVHINNIAAWCAITMVSSYSNPLCYAHHLFLNNIEVTDLVIPDGVTSIGKYAFWNGTGFTSITIPNSVTSIGSCAFVGCEGMPSLTIPESVTSIGEDAFYMVPNVSYSGTATGSPWGARCVNGFIDGPLVYADDTKQNLIACSTAATGEIVIPNSVISIEAYAFYSCAGVTSVTIPESVTSMGEYAFVLCKGLTSIEIPNSVTSINTGTFYNCTSLTSITIPNSVISIGENAFYGCPIEEIHLSDIAAWCGISFTYHPGWYNSLKLYLNEVEITNLVIPDGVTLIGSCAFVGCEGLTSITIPSTVTSIGEYAFNDCDIKEVHISDIAAWCGITFEDNPLWYSSDPHLYFNETEIKDLVIPDGVTSINFGAFSSCSNLTSVTIPNSVTSIGAAVFEFCTGLTSLVIGNTVTSIGEGAFWYCIGLEKITCMAEDVPALEYGVFDDVEKTIPLYVPEGSLDAYKAAEQWKDFSNIQPLKTTGVETIDNGQSSNQPSNGQWSKGKSIKNGQLLILRDGKTYNAAGIVVK